MSETSLPGRLLIVDDDLAVTQTFAQMLTLEGHHVQTANSAASGLQEVSTDHFDAIVLDLRMPLLDGIGFLHRLRENENHRSTPVAVVTGDYFIDDDMSEELRQLGAEVRFKPLWLEDLVDVARSLLNASRSNSLTSPPS